MQLPHSEGLSIGKLAGSFANTAATYKFYWLLAIVELMEEGNNPISKRDIFSRMISNSWYTVNYFHVSFGKQDVIQKATESILQTENLTIDIKKETLLAVLKNATNTTTLKALDHFNKNVPHRFLSPWFPSIGTENENTLRNRIYKASQHFENNCIYALYENHIAINPDWIPYLVSNAKIIKDFCYWNLALFLQSRNPNVPNIPNKLIKPLLRNTLTKQRTYWNVVFKELGTIDCIFTSKKLQANNFVLDHFIPHAFVSHDLLWNLIPIDSGFNSYKSDKLPSIEEHFDSFFELQKTAFEINKRNGNSKLLEDYLTIYPQLKTVNDFNYSRFKESMQPLISIAGNNGFGYLKL